MKRERLTAAVAVASLLAAARPALPGEAPSLAAFLAAPTSEDAEREAERLVAAGVDFDTALEALRRGRSYRKERTGVLERTRRGADGRLYRYLVAVPRSYDPRRRYPLRVFLHGGVGRPAPEAGGRWWRNLERATGDGWIALIPAAWDEAPWWHGAQVDNVSALIDSVKRRYNVDENRVSALGVSDGATGAWFLAQRDADPWAAFVSLIGSPAVLANPAVGADGPVLVGALVSRAFFVVNGERDPLYPAASVEPVMRRLREAGVEIQFRAMPGAGHEVRWWPQVAPDIDAFLDAHPRDPLPDHVVWETHLPERFGRAWWVVVEELTRAGEPGLVDVERRGNRIDIRGQGVRRVRLLLSPDEVDFAAPVVVAVDGATRFEGRIPPDLGVLLRHAARDADRSMLFGAELVFELGGS